MAAWIFQRGASHIDALPVEGELQFRTIKTGMPNSTGSLITPFLSVLSESEKTIWKLPVVEIRLRLELQLVETPQTAEKFLCGRNLHNIMG